jgi:hypothetical protein
MDLETCAKAYDVEGGLVSQTPPPVTSTSTSSSSTTTETPTTTAVPTAPVEEEEEEEEEEETSTSEPVSSIPSPSFVPSATLVRPNSTAITTVQTPQPTETEIQEAGASVTGPAAALVLLAAGFAALL